MALFQKGGYSWLIVGLGNPGKDYDRTRHNVGFRTMDILEKTCGVRINRVKFQGMTAAAELAGHKVLLLKPKTYMNASGLAVEAAASYYKIPAEHVLVISDDINLPVGKIRIRPSGSAGGHNGLKSIISAIGSDGFPRVRVGVGGKPNPEDDLADWVLGRFSAPEEKALAVAMEHAAQAVETVIAEGPEKAAAKFNGL